jgi:hypothetical protein
MTANDLRLWMKTPAMRAATVLLVVAIATVGWTSVQALRADPLPPTPSSAAGMEPIKRAMPPSPADVQAAVESDLFSSDRSAPSAPYRLPGEKAANSTPVAELPKPVVLGTAVANDGRSFATLQLGDERPALVHVGDKIGEWVVKAIDRGKVTIVNSSGGRADLVVPKPGS